MIFQNSVDQARRYLVERNFQQAAMICAEMHAHRSLALDDLPLYAKCLICYGDKVQAQEIIKSLRAENNLSTCALKELGDCFALLENWEMSEHLYDLSLSQDPSYIPSLEQKAKIRHLNRDFVSAIKIYENLVKAAPEKAEYIVSIAKLKVANREFDEAKVHF